MAKQLEDRMVIPNADVLRFFCVENKDSIIGCAWYDTKYCLKNCKFYNQQKESAETSTKVK